MDTLVQRYRDAVASDWEWLRQEDPAVLLYKVFVLLPAVRASRPREELPPEVRRLDAAMGREESIEELLRRRKGAAEEVRRWREEAAGEVRISSEPPVALAEAMRRHPYLVLLGEPGAGKTTTLQYLAWAFATGRAADPQVLGLAEGRVPVLLRLNAVGEKLVQRKPPRLLRALADEVAERLLIQPEEALDLVESWRKAGRLLVLLDGLDEVTGEREREAVVEAVRKFVWAEETSPPPPTPSPSPTGRGTRFVKSGVVG